MSDENKIIEFEPTWIRVTDPNEVMPGGNKGGFISYRGTAIADYDAKSVGQKVPMYGNEYTISHVWRDGKKGDQVSFSFEELILDEAKK